MTVKKQAPYKIILLAIFLITLIAGVLLFITPPAIFPDPSWGFQVMRSMQMGGGFNLIIGPNPTDISKNLSTFLAWWSPGQYLVPYFFKLLLPVNTGQASAITVLGGSLCGLAGFYSFFKKIGFSGFISALSLLFIVCQQAYWIPYGFYNGGELLIFAFEGWFLYGCITIGKPGVKLLLFVLVSGWIGFFCKSSFMWMYAAGLLCLWIRLCANLTGFGAWIKKGLWLGIPAMLSVATIYVFFLSKGENPTSQSSGYKLAWETFTFPVASPLLAGFSVDDLLHGLVYHPGEQTLFTPVAVIAILLVLAAISLFVIVLIVRFVPNQPYRLFIIVFYGMSILFFGYSFLHQANISYEGRHFRLIGLLIVPGIIYLVTKVKLPWQVAFIILCAGIAFKSGQFAMTMHKGNRVSAHGSSGLAQEFVDQPSLNYLMALDRQSKNSIFVFISADIGLEITHNRIITVDPYYPETQPDDLVPYLGHAGPIYFLLPATYNAKETAAMFKYFPGYKNFSAKRLSKGYVLYNAQ